MLFSEIINPNNISEQNAFLLGTIYGRPIFVDGFNKILAYSSYRVGTGSRNKVFIEAVNKDADYYYNAHISKLQRFLGNNDCILLNSDIINLYGESDNNKTIQSSGVSVLIDFDIEFPEDVDIENYLLGIIEKWLIDVDMTNNGEKYKNIFLAGAMESRGSPDFTLKLIAMDVAPRDFPELAKRKKNKYADIVGTIGCNYNPRLTQGELSVNKNDQFRMRLNYYLGHFGLYTPYKIDYYKYENHIEITEDNDDNFFYIDERYANLQLERNTVTIDGENAEINELAIKLKQQGITNEEKKEIIEQYRQDKKIDDDDDEIMYSSQNVKDAAKIRDNYLCEMDHNHTTFTNKSNNEQYVEAHHLIPFSKRNCYDLSIDVIENIVCLCPNCHRKIHLAIDEEKRSLLQELYDKKIEELNNVGIDLDIQALYSYYGIN